LEIKRPIDNDGFTFIRLFAKPKNSNTMRNIICKVDTGANRTTVNRKWLHDLGYDEDWIKSGELLRGDARPIVASGQPIEDCYRVVLPQIRIGDWVGYNWPVITSLSVPFKFLLGTDSMQFFNWYFDYENNICRFNLIPGKRKTLFNQKEQSIHAVDEVDA